MGFVVLAAAVSLATLGRLWWVLRDRSQRRREEAWRRWRHAYLLRLPAMLMARWPKNRTLGYHPDVMP